METMLATYAVAWAAVGLYVAWLARQNGRLARRMEQLEHAAGEERDPVETRANAA